MTFDEMISKSPHVTLADFIQLFLLGYDDKIYIYLECIDDNGQQFEASHIRIIDPILQPFYEREIRYFEEASYECNSFIHIRLKDKEE